MQEAERFTSDRVYIRGVGRQLGQIHHMHVRLRRSSSSNLDSSSISEPMGCFIEACFATLQLLCKLPPLVFRAVCIQ
jgi:hypothetical protein